MSSGSASPRVSLGRALLVALFLLGGTSALSAQADPGTRMLANPALSASHIAFAYDDDLWLAGRDGSDPRRLTTHAGFEVQPHFSPDGQWIAFTGQYDGNLDVFVVSVDGGESARLTPVDRAYQQFPVWLPDGSGIVFQAFNFSTGEEDLALVPASGGEYRTVAGRDGWNTFGGSISPDGRTLLYNEAESPAIIVHVDASGLLGSARR